MSQSPEYMYSELPAIELFQKLGYQYWDGSGTDERTGITEIILKDRLLKAIKRLNPWINDGNLNKAYDKITTTQGTSLMEINQNFWELLKAANYSVKQVIDGKEEFPPVKFIEYDTDRIDDNDFLIVSQLRVHGVARHSIPDLVVYINGLPIGVIECKAPAAHNSFENAYSDLEFYQRNSEKLFYYNQICAGIWGVGGKYGVYYGDVDHPVPGQIDHWVS